MRSSSTLRFVLIIAFVLAADTVFAQRTINVSQGFGTLNKAIIGDTTATGTPVDTTTIYVLQRGGLYILDGELSPKFPVTVNAAAGTGARPRIILGVPTGGIAAEQTIRPIKNFKGKGLYISAQDDLGGTSLRIIRTQAIGVRVELDDCVLDRAGQAVFRIDAAGATIILRNCIASNIGSMTSPDNGRVFDDRGVNVDTIIAFNNTFYNITSKVLRDGGGWIKYAKFDHNTMVNIGQKGVEVGDVNTLIFTNNIMINPVFIGTKFTPTTALSMKPASTAGVTQTAVIRNNNIITNAALISIYPDSIKAATSFDSLSQSYITSGGWTATNISELLTFTKGPATPTASVTAYWKNPAGTQVELDTVGKDSFNFAFPTTAASYKGAIDGKPLGDVRWFGLALGIGSAASQSVPAQFALSQNYPNPFNPETVIRYALAQTASVRLTVFNALGQEVKTLVNDVRTSGAYDARWNGTNNAGQRVSSGLYFYRLAAGSFIETKHMLLIK